MQAAVAMTVTEFCAADVATITTRLAAAFPAVRLTDEQLDAWHDEITLLRNVLGALRSPLPPWTILLEHSPPLSWQRADATIVTAGALVVLEFKLGGQEAFTAANRSQTRRYATKLYWTHPLADGRRVHAVLVATRAAASPDTASPDDVARDELPRTVSGLCPAASRPSCRSLRREIVIRRLHHPIASPRLTPRGPRLLMPPWVSLLPLRTPQSRCPSLRTRSFSG